MGTDKCRYYVSLNPAIYVAEVSKISLYNDRLTPYIHVMHDSYLYFSSSHPSIDLMGNGVALWEGGFTFAIL